MIYINIVHVCKSVGQCLLLFSLVEGKLGLTVALHLLNLDVTSIFQCFKYQNILLPLHLQIIFAISLAQSKSL